MMAQPVPSIDNPLWMSAEGFQARQEAGEVAIVLDVRDPRDWEQSGARISGALRAYPELRIDPRWPKDRLILAFGACPREATSAQVALQLRERGFTQAYALLDGFGAWQSAGFPAEPKVSPFTRGTTNDQR
jgi:rhodanese-related sulfurtransferase